MATETTEIVTHPPVEEDKDDDKPDVEVTESDMDDKVLPAETDDQEDDEWNAVYPPPEDDEGNDLAPPTPPIEGDADGEEKTDEENPGIDEEQLEQPYKERPPPTTTSEELEGDPDFSGYKTNVAERLWRAKKEAKKAGVTASPDIVPMAKEYQHWRQKMAILNKSIEDYQIAMQVVSEKRNKVVEQYALLSVNTPLWDHIGKPLTEDQMSEIKASEEVEKADVIESRTKAIAKVALEIGPGTLMAHQQLAMMHDELNKMDYQNHIVNYIDEWDEVVTSKLDADLKLVRELGKNRDHYINKVDILREKVNKIEHRGKHFAPMKLTDQLERNEKKLDECDVLYEKKANEVSVELFEATKRGWVDFYPVMKNVMKFEINRLGRESSTYGSFHATLATLKSDYKDATKNTADAPNVGSAL